MNSRSLMILLVTLALCGCGSRDHTGERGHGHGEESASEPAARGPHGGRLLEDGAFSLEVTIFESGVPPEFRLYAYRGNQPVPPDQVTASIELSRLGGAVDTFAFTPENDYLRGNAEVREPHSFDVRVQASVGGANHQWSYESYEGRVTMAADVAEASGVRTEIAGKAVIRDNVHLMGGIALNADRHAAIKARFDGTVRAVNVRQGDRVKRGQTLLIVEGNDSMREYPVIAPFDGVVLSRATNVGDVTGGNTLLEIADLSRVWVELHALGDVASRIRAGQKLRLKSATSGLTADATIRSLLPVATRGQSVIARAELDNTSGEWRPGMTVSAEVAVNEREVPLAVRESALQRFRDFAVVFAQVGDTYEVRMLELGLRDGEFAEVLGGLDPGTRYVTAQSFLLKADIEKSGAAHDH
jgi:cobalt-zinc-cadmium efflux system membrane fusion protein